MKALPHFSARRFLTIACAVLLAASARAQLVNDGATNTLSNVTNTFTGDVTVGTNGSFTLLTLANSALLTNTVNGIIGRNLTAKSNEVRLISSTARWQMGRTLYVGSNGAVSRLVVSNGALIESGSLTVGNHPAGSNNEVIVTGPGSTLNAPGLMFVGADGNANRLAILNGGKVFVTNSGSAAFVGFNQGIRNNSALIADPGSRWSVNNTLVIGSAANASTLVVSNGASVDSANGTIGNALTASNSLALVTGSGSIWSNTVSLRLGDIAPNNQLIVSNGGSVFAGGFAYVGLNSQSTGNRLTVDGGTLRVTNATATGLLDVRRGTNVMNAGLMEVDSIMVTNALARFEHNGGTIVVGKVTVPPGQWTTIGNGTDTAVLLLKNNVFHVFSDVLTVSSNATLMGIGNIAAGIVVLPGGTISPGIGPGDMALLKSVNNNNHIVLLGNTIMEIKKIGALLFSDRLETFFGFSFGGSLIVTNIGSEMPTLGDRIQLFDALTYQESFASITLPPLPPGLSWTNKLIVEGSIEVIGGFAPTVKTLPPIATTNSANLNGVANPKGTNSSAWFDWGTTTNYGSFTALHPLGSGTNDINFGDVLNGLTLGAVYHTRAVASNSFGISFGADRSFIPGLITYLKASNTRTSSDFESPELFSASVAISGDTIVVGAPGEDSNATGVNGNQSNTNASGSGAAYVFVRAGTTWTQQGYLKASNTGSGDSFGTFVAISGDTAVVGAPSEDSDATGVNGNGNSNSKPDSGAAYVFVRTGTNWTQQAYLKASNTDSNDFFANSVAISGDTIVVGARFESSSAAGVNGNQSDNSSTNSGAAYVFVRTGTNWTQQAYLKASNTGASDEFGRLVAISGDTIVAGATGESSNATGVNGDQSDNSFTNSGAAYVFVRTGTNWTQQAYLKAHNTGSGDLFGITVTASGNTIVVGASGEDSNATGVNGDGNDNSATGSGAAYVFARSGINWAQQAYLKASNAESSDQFGIWVALNNDTLVVGAVNESSDAAGINGDGSGNSAFGSGAAYLFTRNGTNWSQQSYLKASNTEDFDAFGRSVAVLGSLVVVGAVGEDSNARGVNGDQNDNSVSLAGAAYVFDLSLFTTPALNISPSGVSQVTLSWTPPTPGFALQESLSLSPVSWSNSPSGETNPITLPASGQTKFFRLLKP